MSAIPLTIPTTFLLNVYSEKGTIFSGQVYALSTKNEVGPLSILSGHAHFISLLTGPVVIFDTPNTKQGQTVPMELGVLRAYNNTVEVYVGVELSQIESKDEEAV